MTFNGICVLFHKLKSILPIVILLLPMQSLAKENYVYDYNSVEPEVVATKITYPKTFIEAKAQVRKIFADMRFTFYCDCKFDANLNIDLKSCGYKVRKNLSRARRVEFEHIVPVENFGRAMPSRCWQRAALCKQGIDVSGRECCLETDQDFRNMYNDLHNIVPAIGEINADRSNYRFAALTKTDFKYGDCQFKIDFNGRKVEPRNAVKGTVARAYLYFNKQYCLKLSNKQLELFELWHKLYPPEEWEIAWDNRVAVIQGNHNPFIVEKHKEEVN